MPRQSTILQGHPDPGGNRFCHALADAYAEGAVSAGHKVMRVEVARLDFPMLRTQEEFEHGHLPETLVETRDAIVSAQHLVMVFPLWHGTMPALLKAFLEQVMRPGVALEYRKHGFPRGLLAGRSARSRDDGHASADLPMVLSGARGARARTEHPEVLWHGSGPRDPTRDGRHSRRCQATAVARPDPRLRQAPRLSLALPRELPARSTALIFVEMTPEI